MAVTPEVIAARAEAALVLAQADETRAETARRDDAAAAERARLAEETRADIRRKDAADRDARAQRERADCRARWKRRRAAVATVLGRIRGDADAAAAMTVYTAAVGTALYGQLTAAHDHGLPAPIAIAAAVALEGWALAAARTALRLRLEHGERAVLPRTAMAVAGAVVAAINVAGHWPHVVTVDGVATQSGSRATAVILGLLSLGAITMWELRSGARHRPALRARGLLAEPLPWLGLRYWTRYPLRAWWARSASIAAPSIRTRAAAIRAGELLRALRAQARVDARNARTAARHRAQVAQLAREAARDAAKKGAVQEALAQLRAFAAANALPLAAQPRAAVRADVRDEPADPREAAQETALAAHPDDEPARPAQDDRADAAHDEDPFAHIARDLVHVDVDLAHLREPARTSTPVLAQHAVEFAAPPPAVEPAPDDDDLTDGDEEEPAAPVDDLAARRAEKNAALRDEVRDLLDRGKAVSSRALGRQYGVAESTMRDRIKPIRAEWEAEQAARERTG
jgi:hypothetical protein